MAEKEEKEMAKAAETETKAVDKKEEVKEKAAEAAKEVSDKAKGFMDKQFGPLKGLHICIGVVVLVLVVLCLKCCGGGKEIDYPLVYKDGDGNIMLLTAKAKEKNAVKLASEGSTSVVYANTTNRYLVFKKNDAIYLYDAKAKEETSKLLTDTELSKVDFTPNDKYIVAVNKDGVLYSIIPGKDKEKLDSDVSRVVGVTDDKVVYRKEDKLYIRSLKAKKDDREKIVEEYDSAVFSEDGKVVVYTDEENDLYVYKVSKKKAEKIDSDVTDFGCAKDTCTKLGYLKKDDDKSKVYYYNGSKSTELVDELDDVLNFDVDKQLIVYSNDDEVYFKNGKKDAYKMDDDVMYAFFLEGKSVVYLNKDYDAYIAKISGKKLGSAKKIGEDVGNWTVMDGKVALVANKDDDGLGDLYIATTSKSKKIDSDVYYSKLQVNSKGNKLYYFKSYKSNAGDLYYTTGGKGKKIDSDVASYVYIKDDLMYYIKDYSSSKGHGDLYRYTGKSTKITDSVSSMSNPPVKTFLDK